MLEFTQLSKYLSGDTICVLNSTSLICSTTYMSLARPSYGGSGYESDDVSEYWETNSEGAPDVIACYGTEQVAIIAVRVVIIG